MNQDAQSGSCEQFVPSADMRKDEFVCDNCGRLRSQHEVVPFRKPDAKATGVLIDQTFLCPCNKVHRNGERCETCGTTMSIRWTS